MNKLLLIVFMQLTLYAKVSAIVAVGVSVKSSLGQNTAQDISPHFLPIVRYGKIGIEGDRVYATVLREKNYSASIIGRIVSDKYNSFESGLQFGYILSKAQVLQINHFVDIKDTKRTMSELMWYKRFAFGPWMLLPSIALQIESAQRFYDNYQVLETAYNIEAELLYSYELSKSWVLLGTLFLNYYDQAILSNSLIDTQVKLRGSLGLGYKF